MRLQMIISSLFLLLTAVQAALLGIDYGQDFLKSTLIAPGIPFEIVLTLETKRKEPVGLAMKPIADSVGEFERFYGAASSAVCSRFPETCVSGLKSLLGQSFTNQSLIDSYNEIHPGASTLMNKKRTTIDYKLSDDAVFQIEELNAMILSHVKDRAQKMLKQETGSDYLNSVVLTVPAYFTTAQRNALINSAKVAGFINVQLIDDGVAVAVNYASGNIRFDNSRKTQTHLIYDLGASGIRATLLDFTKNSGNSAIEINVKSYSADQGLGGEYFTKIIFDILKNKFLDKNPKIKAKDFNSNKKSMVRLWQSAEKTKLILSANNEASASIESLYDGIDFRGLVTRQEYEDVVSQFQTRITQPIINALHEGGIKITDLDSILLFGGSTRTPIVQKFLTALTDKEDLLSKNVNADEAAVQGATLQGVILSKMFRAKDIKVNEFSLREYSVEFIIDGNEDSVKTKIINKGDKVGEVVSIPLNDLKNSEKDFNINLYEEDELIETSRFKNVKSDIKKAVDRLSKTFDLEKCKQSSGLNFEAFFYLSDDKLFQIKNVTASCDGDANKGFFQNILDKGAIEEDDDSKNTTNTNSTASLKSSIKKSKKLHAAITSTKEYNGIRPLSSIQRDVSQRKLRDLSVKDHIRAQKTELMNTLESELYSLRNNIYDIIDEIEEGSSKKFDKKNLSDIKAFQQLISDYLEWLEEESYNLKELKTSAINRKIEKLNIISNYLNDPIDLVQFEDVKNQIELIFEEFQAVQGDYNDKLEKLLANYLENGFTKDNFEKDSTKIAKSSIIKIEELNLETETLNLLEILQKIDKIIEELKSNKEVDEEEIEKILSKFETYNNSVDKINQLSKLKLKIEKEQKRRFKQLEKSLELRLKKTKEKLEIKTITDDEEVAESIEENIKSTNVPEHDEL